ncbi:MAG TPA: hypothetical protein VHC73_12820 [Vitreimonas sp.]|mgnify:CR=1 FL=1|jgi:hypothetical protein|nr:hypothetical protein [Vitreimonas sp.]
MRSVIVVMLAAAVLATGACSRRDQSQNGPDVRPQTIVSPENTPVDAVPQEEPAVSRQQWRAVNDRTRNTTGNLRVSIERQRGGPLIFAYATGVTLQAQNYQVVSADARSGVGGQSFAALLGGDPRVSAWLYRVNQETLAPTAAAAGGLCGQATTRYLAVSEFVDATGAWVFKVAAFRGDIAPGSGQDPLYCGNFSYAAQ